MIATISGVLVAIKVTKPGTLFITLQLLMHIQVSYNRKSVENALALHSVLV